MDPELRKQLEKKAFNKFTEEETIIRGCIYVTKPGPGYAVKVKEQKTPEEHRALSELKERLCTQLRVPRSMIEVDKKKGRLLTSEKIVMKHKEKLKQMNLIPAVVEEMPEQDFLEVQIDFI